MHDISLMGSVNASHHLVADFHFLDFGKSLNFLQVVKVGFAEFGH